jgi:hypothetical protein
MGRPLRILEPKCDMAPITGLVTQQSAIFELVMSQHSRLTLPQPIEALANGSNEGVRPNPPSLRPGVVFMMGDNPSLPKMPRTPRLLDFFQLRFNAIARQHLLQSAKLALDGGHEEKVVMACLLHDIAMGALIRVDHGYWGAQLIAPYVSEEIRWAVEHHQALRYFADESVGYNYPTEYIEYFGADYRPPEYIQKANEEARNHRWYMTSRLVTLNDKYAFAEGVSIDPTIFTDIIGRHFKEPREGLGFDGSRSAHMWRSMIWPNNFL